MTSEFFAESQLWLVHVQGTQRWEACRTRALQAIQLEFHLQKKDSACCGYEMLAYNLS